MEIERGSWHFHLATQYSNLTEWDLRNNNVNFCKYFWRVVRGFGMASVFVGLGVVVAGSWLNVVVPAYHWLFLDTPWMWLFDPSVDPFAPGNNFGDRVMVGYAILTVMALVLQAVIVFMAACAVIMEVWSSIFPARIPDNEDQPLPTGFFRTAYRAWKEKYCPLVTMKTDNEQ